jgi:hypothetical protein
VAVVSWAVWLLLPECRHSITAFAAAVTLSVLCQLQTQWPCFFHNHPIPSISCLRCLCRYKVPCLESLPSTLTAFTAALASQQHLARPVPPHSSDPSVLLQPAQAATDPAFAAAAGSSGSSKESWALVPAAAAAAGSSGSSQAAAAAVVEGRVAAVADSQYALLQLHARGVRNLGTALLDSGTQDGYTGTGCILFLLPCLPVDISVGVIASLGVQIRSVCVSPLFQRGHALLQLHARGVRTFGDTARAQDGYTGNGCTLALPPPPSSSLQLWI